MNIKRLKKKKKLSFIPMVFATQKTKQSLNHLGPKPQARTKEMHENTEQSTTNNISRLKDQGQARNSILLVC